MRPLFDGNRTDDRETPRASIDELTASIVDCIGAGAHVLNISAAVLSTAVAADGDLGHALDLAAHRGVIVVAAAGNQSRIGGSALTRHPWVVPIVSYDHQGHPMEHSNLGRAVGQRGLGAPGDRVWSLGSRAGRIEMFGGTSAAAPFVTGTFALLLSEFGHTSVPALKLAVLRNARGRRGSVIPPLLDAWTAYGALKERM